MALPKKLRPLGAALAIFLAAGCATPQRGRMPGTDIAIEPGSVMTPEVSPGVIEHLIQEATCKPPPPAAARTNASVMSSNGLSGHHTQPPAHHFSVRECPPLSDDAVIVARVSASPSGAPRTQHPALDLYVEEDDASYLVRIHFGDRGDGQNSCLDFDECKGMRTLSGAYPVKTALARDLFAYLKKRDYCVGKFCSWGMCLLPRPSGSNCGDAFIQVVERLEIAPVALREMRQWITDNDAGKWAFDRGRRRLVDEFFQRATVKILP